MNISTQLKPKKTSIIKKVLPSFLFSLTFLMFLSSAHAQVTQEWLKRYDFGGTSDIAVRVVTDDSGNVYVTGSGGPLGNTDIITIKYDSSGYTKWTKTWKGPGNSYDAPNAMTIKGNAIYITGFTEYAPLIQSNRRKDFATLKYDLNGTLLWSAYYNFSVDANWEDIAYAIDVDPQSNVYITGSSKSAQPQVGYRDIATIKYDVNGHQEWVARYNAPDENGASGTDDDIPTALQIDQSGNVYITGYSVGATSGYDYVTLKYSTTGVNLWVKRYTMPGNYLDAAYALKLDSNANVYVTGASSAHGVDPALWYDYATIKYNTKYNTNGDALWVRRFNSGSSSVPWDEARDLVVDDTGNVYVTGFAPSATTYGDDIYTLKYNANGKLIWQSRWDSPFGYEDHPNRLRLDKAGNIYITGYSKSDGSTAGDDYITLKLDNSGQLQWAQRYDGSNHTIDIAYDLVLDNNNNVYVTGQSYQYGDDYFTIKYVQRGTCTKPGVTITTNDSTTFCGAGSAKLKAESTIKTVTYQWKFNGTDINGATLPIYNASSPGKYSVTVTNDCGSSTSKPIKIAIKKIPDATITPAGTVNMCEGETTILSANTGANLTYQWKRNNMDITGANSSTHNATTPGKYSVIVTNNSTGCSNSSSFTTIKITCKANQLRVEPIAGLAVYPNPSSTEFTIELNTNEAHDLIVYDLAGREIISLNNITSGQKFGGGLKSGIYIAQVKKRGEVIKVFKLVKDQ